LRTNPGDKLLAKEFERLKKAAGAAKSEFQSGQVGAENLRRALAAQGVNVGKLSESYGRLKASMQAAGAAQPKIAPISTTSRTTATGASTAATKVSSSVQPRDVDGLSVGIDRLNGKLKTMGHLTAAVFAIQQYVLPYLVALGRVSDSYIKLNAQLALATRNGGSLAKAQADVVRIAAAAQTGLGETAQLYARLTSSVSRLGFSQQKVADITETVALSLRVSGATAQESASAILQLSQAFGSGVLRGEEFNAVNEASPRLMQALADTLGRPKEELRGLAESGALTAKVLALAIGAALGLEAGRDAALDLHADLVHGRRHVADLAREPLQRGTHFAVVDVDDDHGGAPARSQSISAMVSAWPGKISSRSSARTISAVVSIRSRRMSGCVSTISRGRIASVASDKASNTGMTRPRGSSMK
jgi:tape measure domain-containing protein